MVSSPAIPQPGMTPAAGMALPPQPVGGLTTQSVTPPPSAKPADPPSRRTRVIQPLNDPDKKVNLQDLVERELAKEGGDTKLATADEERQVVNDQINDFIKSPASQPAAEASQLPPVNPPNTTPTPPNPSPTPPQPSTPSGPTWPTTPSSTPPVNPTP
jgi:hypothetical protein